MKRFIISLFVLLLMVVVFDTTNIYASAYVKGTSSIGKTVVKKKDR